ncbi:hypothetical protein LIN78_01560 [Leeia sp. TBRC 13508]|uniref:Uncharacterized protein n=1 Tax=Leeia speluncae TaxID=2884804 RepID=A0ABS8D220_9NEIS|nr:hypothetical protein [Leeia speluncae]MCB6182243.1 hypothetical protein [Leeia speluncae]
MSANWAQLIAIIENIQSTKSQEDLQNFCDLLPELESIMQAIQSEKLAAPDQAILEQVQSGLDDLSEFIKSTLPQIQVGIQSTQTSAKLNKFYGS